MKMEVKKRITPAPDPALARMGAGQINALGELLAVMGVGSVRVKHEPVGGGFEWSVRFDRAPAVANRPAAVDAVAHVTARAVGELMRVMGAESLNLEFTKEDIARLESYYRDAETPPPASPAPKITSEDA
jgi:hypothetical protein